MSFNLKYSEPKVLFSKRELDRILNLNKPMAEPLTSDLQSIKNNIDFASNSALSKIEENKKWNKISEKLTPIVNPIQTRNISMPDISLAQDQAISQSDISQTDNTLGNNELVDFLEESFPATSRGRALMLARILEEHPEIKITKRKIFVNERPLPSTTINVLKHLIGTSKKLHYNLMPLFQVLSLSREKELLKLIRNKEALNILRSPTSGEVDLESQGVLTSTPLDALRRRPSRKRQEFSSPIASDKEDDEANETSYQDFKSVASSAYDSDQFSDAKDKTIGDKKGSGFEESAKEPLSALKSRKKKTSLRWSTLF